ncbi:hypothetical protein [Desmospora activa]|uniref:Uncharacterized protein n=1 Tax=Desmospora activa DSM 45169 TaxID=1121389 RepID=A0A2T4ZDD2_9BACL|nr:hypothetical protein [Desmospora activa]PTM59895.1 hypothetical protein C8J48_2532 [Desmospora activa DSM 45169]
MGRRNLWTILMGLFISLIGVSCLYCGEKARSRHQMEMCCGWGILGFGLAHILMGGIVTVIGGKR